MVSESNSCGKDAAYPYGTLLWRRKFKDMEAHLHLRKRKMGGPGPGPLNGPATRIASRNNGFLRRMYQLKDQEVKRTSSSSIRHATRKKWEELEAPMMMDRHDDNARMPTRPLEDEATQTRQKGTLRIWTGGEERKRRGGKKNVVSSIGIWFEQEMRLAHRERGGAEVTNYISLCRTRNR